MRLIARHDGLHVRDSIPGAAIAKHEIRSADESGAYPRRTECAAVAHRRHAGDELRLTDDGLLLRNSVLKARALISRINITPTAIVIWIGISARDAHSRA
jgi:hypothetical protein